MSRFARETAKGSFEVVTLNGLRAENPQISFPRVITPGLMVRLGLQELRVDPEPAFDPLTETVSSAGLEGRVDHVAQGWVVERLPLAEAADNVRTRRDELLAETDWTQVADAPVEQAVWQAYRQALRDVPEQVGFPWEVNWP